MKHLVSLAITLMITCAAMAQTGEPGRRAKDLRAGSITGRVINEAGQPLAGAIVGVSEVGRRQAGYRTFTADDEGRFRITDLAPGVYAISPRAPGYAMPGDITEATFYRPGDTANITMIKGGVITGTVTNAAGEPLTLAPVRALRVRELDGRPVRNAMASAERTTDDRGVYRLYGLRPGTYLIFTGGRAMYSYYQASAFDEDVSTYYPSSTRDTAAEVTVRSGEEVAAIDIRHRGERGRAVSGKITGIPVAEAQRGGFTVILTNPSNQAIEAQAYIDPRFSGYLTFAFYGVADGEYNLFATWSGSEKDPGYGSARVPVKVKGADVAGLSINVAPYGSIAGQVVIETAQPGLKEKCESKKQATTEETIVHARPDDKETVKGVPLQFLNFTHRGAPGEKGDFFMNNIEAGLYYISASLPDDSLYIRAVTMPASAPSLPAIDAAKSGIAIKPGARITGLIVTVAEGAASLSGQVTAATETERLPDRLRVHLVPAEKESADNALRFYERLAQGDGSFSIKNVAPGRYRIIARPATDEDERPAARDQAERRKLRAEAEAANIAIELEPCRRVSDYKLRYTPAAKTTEKKR